MLRTKVIPGEFRDWIPVLSTTWVVLGLLFGTKLSAQGAPGGDRAVTLQSESYPFPLPSREVTRDLSRILQRFERGERREALVLLQKILNRHEDSLLPPENSLEQTNTRTLRREILSILSKMPLESIVEYDLLYGGEAAAKIAEARESDNWDEANELSIRYLFTKPGKTLTLELALRHLDHGEFISAELLLDRLLTAERAWNDVSPLNVILAIHVRLKSDPISGKTFARKLLERERDALNGKQVFWGTEVWTFPIHEEEFIEKLARTGLEVPARGFDHWILPRQSIAGTSVSPVGAQSLTERWSQTTAKWQDVLGADSGFPDKDEPQDPLDDFFHRVSKRNLPLIPAWVPLIVDDLAIFRTARRLHAVELASGKTRWISAEGDASYESIQKMFSPNTQQAGSARQSVVSALEGRAWGDRTFGSLSSDGRNVYSVEGTELWTNSGTPDNFHPERNRVRNYNRLVANDLRTGKVIWELGGPDSDSEKASDGNPHVGLQGCYFLGPPLPLHGLLYALVERRGDVLVSALKARDGKLLWSQTLLTAGESPIPPTIRRTQGLTPVAADGILICPTGIQALVAIDLTSRSVLWGSHAGTAVTYTEGDLRKVQAGLGGIRGLRSGYGYNLELPFVDRWVDSMLEIVGDRLLYGPVGGDFLQCLDVRTGNKIWESDRGKGILVAGHCREKILIVERNRISAIRLSDGEPAWPEPIPETVSSGRGYFNGNHYHFPLINGEIATIDVDSGSMILRRRSRGEKPLGNLIAARGTVLSQSFDTVSSYDTLEDEARTQGIAVATPPVDPPGWALRGALAVLSGNPGEGYADFRTAWQMGRETSVRDLWLSSLAEGMRVDPERYRKFLDAGDLSMARGSQWEGTWVYLTTGELIQHGDLRQAEELLLKTLAQEKWGHPPDRLRNDLAAGREEWIAIRFREIFERASSESATELEKPLLREWEHRSNDRAGQRRLQSVLRDLPFGRELASRELSMEGKSTNAERELWLQRILQSGDKTLLPRATAQLARAYLQRGDLPGATQHLRMINGDFQEQQVEGSTLGKELLKQWEQNGLLNGTEPPPSWPIGKLTATVTPHAQSDPTWWPAQPLYFDPREPPAPSLQVIRESERLIAKNSAGEVKWEYPLSLGLRPMSGGKWYYSSLGSLLLLTNAVQLVCLDVSQTRSDREVSKLWSMELVDPGDVRTFAQQERNSPFRIMPERPIRIFDSLGETGGQLLSCSEESIVVYRDESLWGLNPLSGAIRWVHRGFPNIPSAIPWRGNLYLLRDRLSRKIEVVSLRDGGTLAIVELPRLDRAETAPPSQKQDLPVILPNVQDEIFVTREGWLFVCPHKMNGRMLSLIDPEGMKIVWEHRIEAGSILAFQEQLPSENWRADQSSKLAILTPPGHLKILTLADGKTISDTDISRIEGARSGPFILLSTPEHDLILFQTPAEPGGTTRHLAARHPGKIPFNGTIVAFERETGEIAWKRSGSRLSSLLEISASHPVLAIQSFEQITGGPPEENSPPVRPAQQLTLIDRRNGTEILSRNIEASESSNLMVLGANIDRDKSTVRLIVQTKLSSPQLLIEVKGTDGDPVSGSLENQIRN